jgi:hypothetical protein
VDKWLEDHGTDSTLCKCLIEYAHERGGKTMSEIVGWRRGALQTLADSMDLIGWRRFMEGMISKEIVAIQCKAEVDGRCKMTVDNRSAGLVMKLLEVTHGQWLYRNVHVHDIFTGERARMQKEEIWKELEYQIALGGEELEEEDQYLLEINLEDLDSSTGEDQVYWLLALQTARRTWQIQREKEGSVGTVGTR